MVALRRPGQSCFRGRASLRMPQAKSGRESMAPNEGSSSETFRFRDRPLARGDDQLVQRAMADHDAGARPAPGAKEELPYGLHRPAGEKMPTTPQITYQLSQAELNPLRPPEPPPWPLWQGIYFFPWRGDSLALW